MRMIFYFIRSVIWGKSRQSFLIAALLALSFSAGALLVLQSVMGGLQYNLMERSKKVLGNSVLLLAPSLQSPAKVKSIVSEVKKLGFQAVPETYLEMLAQFEGRFAPVFVHALAAQYTTPPFLEPKQLGRTLIGYDLSKNLKAYWGGEITLISPTHMDEFLGDIPRQVSTTIDESVLFDVPEVELNHLWIRHSLIQNIIREESFNRIVLYGNQSMARLKTLLQKNWGEGITLVSWEDQHQELMYALNLEKIVMLTLFCGMCFLVVFSVVSAQLIFLNKIKVELLSFWILGLSPREIKRMLFYLINLFSFLATSFGVGVAFALLRLWESLDIEVMPAVFVEKKIPVILKTSYCLWATAMPLGLSFLFSFYALWQLSPHKESYLSKLRQIM